MFFGTHHNNVDAKGRVSLPASFRTMLSQDGLEGVILWRSFNGPFLEGGGPSRLRALRRALDEMGPYDERRNAFEMVIFGASRQLNVDGTGRITLPREFLDHVGLEREAVFVGMDDRFEVHAPAAHEALLQEKLELARRHRNDLRPVREEAV